MSQVSSFNRVVLYARALIYWLVFSVATILLGTTIIIGFWLPFNVRYLIKRLWVFINLQSLRLFCGLDYEIEGLENIPGEPTIVFAKHQSLYEVLVIVKHLPKIAWVLKRELLWIPFFGWSLALVKPTPIDRKSGRKAVEQVVMQGRKSLEDGRWVVIFPEGTRTAPGAKPRYKSGGAILATETGYAVLPIAHNAGEYWPKGSLIKWPGKVKVSIGSVIESKNKQPEQLLKETENWIENKMQEISDPARWNR